jgi:hypothetical protein
MNHGQRHQQAAIPANKATAAVVSQNFNRPATTQIQSKLKN